MLEYTPEVAHKTADLQERVKDFIPPVEWPVVAPLIHEINELKKAKNAVILAHKYQTPDIYHCVADFVGDSLQLAIQAGKTDADIIVQAGVHFMAETSKLLSPDKTVLIPSLEAGCSLAASITGEDVRRMKQKYPGVPVVTYVNTSADVKAESDCLRVVLEKMLEEELEAFAKRRKVQTREVIQRLSSRAGAGRYDCGLTRLSRVC